MAKKGVNYLYGIDFTDRKAILATISVGPVHDIIATLLKEKTNDQWERLTTEGYSLVDAVVEYNGVNDLTTRPTISSYKNICIIKLGECCTEVTGRIYLHYN
jgi:hypothetical protein